MTPSAVLWSLPAHIYVCTFMYTQHTHTHQHAIPTHHGVSRVPVCTLDESVSHFFPSLQFHLFYPPPICQEFYCHGRWWNRVFHHANEEYKKTFRAGLPLHRVSECILFTLLSSFTILRGSRLSPDHTYTSSVAFRWSTCHLTPGLSLTTSSLANQTLLSHVQIWKVGSTSTLAFLVRFKRWV